MLRALALPPHEGAASAAVSSGKVLGTSIIAPGREGSQSGSASRLRCKEQDVVELRSLHPRSPAPPPAEEAEQG